MIEFQNASRWYGEVIGMNDITCTIPAGVTALLGQNGAGKSTLLKVLTGQLRPTTGKVLVKGMEPFANPEVHRIMGYCPEIDNFYEDMTGRAFVNHLARLHGLSKEMAEKRTEEKLIMVGMAERAAGKIRGYSKGMRQRIKLAQAMLHNPDIILLDEPLNGLDPVGRRDLMNLLGQLGSQGKAIVVSSHILFEVEQMTRNILLLHRGRLLASGDLRTIRELIDKFPHRVSIETETPNELASALVRLPFVTNLSFEPTNKCIEIQTRDLDKFFTELQHVILAGGVRVTGFTSPDNNLESIYQYLVEA